MHFWPDSASRPSTLEQEASCLASFSLEDPVWPARSEPSSAGQGAAPALEGLALPFCHCHPGHHHHPQMKRMRRMKKMMMMMTNQRKMKMMRSCLTSRLAEPVPAEVTKGEKKIT